MTKLDLGKIIRSGLERKHMTNIELANLVGLQPTSVSMWLANKSKPPADKMIQIMEVLDIVPDLFPKYRQRNLTDTKRLLMNMDYKLEKILDKHEDNSGLQILIVEDQFMQQYMLQGFLDIVLPKVGVKPMVVCARSAEEGLEILIESTRKTSLIILDILMPGMGGTGFLERITQNSDLCQIPILIITGAPNSVIAELMEYSGVFAILRKPAELKQFTQVIQKIDLAWPLKRIKV